MTSEAIASSVPLGSRYVCTVLYSPPETPLTVFPRTAQPAGPPPLAPNTFAPVGECTRAATPLALRSSSAVSYRRSSPSRSRISTSNVILFFLATYRSVALDGSSRGVSPLSTLLPIVSDHSSNSDAVLMPPFEHIQQRAHHVASYSGGGAPSYPCNSLSTMRLM